MQAGIREEGIESRAELVERSADPFNAETPLTGHDGLVTPVSRFYVRNHFAVPGSWDGLRVDGAVHRPLRLALSDLTSLPARTLSVTLECAGNGRAFLRPPVPGVAWELGAVGTARWTGVPLATVLELAGLREGVVEILFEGADSGVPRGASDETIFARSLPLAKALDRDTLLVYAMNDAPLTPDHGAPLRLIVPGWYGMASVKWLTRVSALRTPFQGHFQARDYVVPDGSTARPLQAVRPRAIITAPATGRLSAPGPHVIRGYAWSGEGPIRQVEVSVDGGMTWQAARLGEEIAYSWRAWELPWEPGQEGEFVLLARALDEAGGRQPLEQVWTASGYANNACQPVRVSLGAAERQAEGDAPAAPP